MNCQKTKKRKNHNGVRPLGRLLAILAAFLCGLAFCTQGKLVYAATSGEQNQDFTGGQVVMDVSYGYDETAKGGRYLPLSVTVYNNGESDLYGTLQIQSLESDGSVYQYDYPVTAGGDSSETAAYHIPLGTRADQLFLTLAGEDGNPLVSRRIRLNVSLDVPELLIGILADEPDALNYLNGAGIRYSTLRTRTFALKEDQFPQEEIGLNLLDVLVVNGYKLRNLSEKQTAAIMDWVYSGGVLILGTGDRVDDTLGRFAPELLDDSYGAPDLRQIHMGDEFSVDNPGDSIVTVPTVDIPLHGGNVIFSSQGFPVLTAAAKGQGLIAVAAFDFADIAEFCKSQPAYVDKFFTNLLGEELIDRLSEVAYGGSSGNYWAVQSLINTGNVDKLPNLLHYAGVVFVYLILLGPGLYLFLKSRDLQIYYRSGVVALSVCFALLIYLMGTGTRFRSTFYTYATIQDVTDDYVNEATYVNIRSPYNRDYSVELDSAYSVLPITRSSSGESGRLPELTGQEEYKIAIIQEADKTRIEGQNVTAFEPRYFRLERKQDNVDRIGISGEVDYFEGRLTGSVTNQFSFPLENTSLVLFGNLVVIDRLEPGETKVLDDLDLLRFPLNNSYAVAEWITGGRQYQQADIDDKEYLLAMERANMLRFYLDSYLSGYSADARVIAFSTEKEESQFLKTPSEESYGLTMLTSSIAVNASRDRSLYRSVLMKTPSVSGGNYTVSTNSTTGTDPVTLEYYLGNDIEVESLTFEPVSDAFFQVSGDAYIEMFRGSVYFYNYNTGNFDLMDLDGKTLGVSQLTPYLSSENAMTVRYVYEGAGSYSSIQLPMPMVAGRER